MVHFKLNYLFHRGDVDIIVNRTTNVQADNIGIMIAWGASVFPRYSISGLTMNRLT